MGLRAPWGLGMGWGRPSLGWAAARSPGGSRHSPIQPKAPPRKEWGLCQRLSLSGPLVVNPGPQAIASVGRSSSFLGPGTPGPHGSRICALVPTHALTHIGSSLQTLRLKKASFKVELTSERGEDDVPTLEGFPVDGPGTVFLVFLLGDPHLLKGIQGGQDRAADPRGIQSLLRRRYPDLHVFWGQFLHFTQ